MITLIHGTDQYLSYKFMKDRLNEFSQKGYEVKIINVDEDSEIPDQTSLFALLTEQDLFGTPKILALKRITSCDLFYKLGKPLKTSDKLFESIKNSSHEIILWEDKLITTANPLFKLAKESKTFNAPARDYEVTGYINQYFKDLKPEIKKLLSTNLKTTDTYEITTEIEKLKSTPQEYLNHDNLVLSSTTPSWIISDAITAYIAYKNSASLKKVFDVLKSIDEDIRYKLAVIQNHISEMIYVKQISKSKNNQLRDSIFSGRRAFVYQKIEKALGKVTIAELYELYLKSIITEYLLNKGLIIEEIALENIFAGDVKSMSLELIVP